MDANQPNSHLPAQIADAVSGIPKALIPASIKALDRLVGAFVDLPVAWLSQQKARIDAKTESYKMVEATIAHEAAEIAGADKATIQRAVSVLVRKEYRKQTNREAVAAATIEDLRSTEEIHGQSGPQPNGQPAAHEVDEDWLNVFERYAEDASTERMQKLWGRVLAGEIRKPGHYSMRTLRFLSEFSQSDALLFEQFANIAFRDFAPKKLVVPTGTEDIRQLVYLESAGLIHGASSMGVAQTLHYNPQGCAFITEGTLVIVLIGQPGSKVEFEVVALTPLGQELLSLLPGRDPRAAARRVAVAIRSKEIEAADLAVILPPNGQLFRLESLWAKDAAAST
jgi:hypothetical protein